MLSKVRGYLSSNITEEERKVLNIFEKTFLCYIIEDKDALALKELIANKEANLATMRNNMKLGYICPTTNDFIRYLSSIYLLFIVSI